MSPIAARNVAATITLTPGHGHQPARSRASCSACGAITRSTCGDLAVEEVDLAQAAVDGLALLDRQLELGQPRAALACRTDR